MSDGAEDLSEGAAAEAGGGELSAARHIMTFDSFLPPADARALRGVFDARFGDARAVRPERFLWDYWHIAGQYTLLRTQVRACAARPGPARPCAHVHTYGVTCGIGRVV